MKYSQIAKKMLFLLFVIVLITSCEETIQEVITDNVYEPVDPGPFGNADSSDIKILIIGNSITYYNYMPEIFWEMINATGRKVYLDQATIPGAQIVDHLYRDFTTDKINSAKWDVVFLQEAISDIGFKSGRDTAYANILEIKQRILANNPSTEIYYTLPYATRGGFNYGINYYPYAEAQKLLRDGTVILADTLDMAVAPMGWAWYKIVQTKPEIELFHWDGAHPSPAGSYFDACVYYVSLFKESAVDNPLIIALDQKTANTLEEIATSTVMDSLAYWRLE